MERKDARGFGLDLKWIGWLLLYYDNIVFLLVPFVYGIYILSVQSVWVTYAFSSYSRNILVERLVVGIAFVALSLMKLLGIIWRKPLVRQIAQILLTSAWCFYGVIFLFTIPPSSDWMFAFVMVGMGLKLALKE